MQTDSQNKSEVELDVSAAEAAKTKEIEMQQENLQNEIQE